MHEHSTYPIRCDSERANVTSWMANGVSWTPESIGTTRPRHKHQASEQDPDTHQRPHSISTTYHTQLSTSTTSLPKPHQALTHSNVETHEFHLIYPDYSSPSSSRNPQPGNLALLRPRLAPNTIPSAPAHLDTHALPALDAVQAYFLRDAVLLARGQRPAGLRLEFEGVAL